MSVRVRFAPSPTGPLHIGGVRTALYNYLFARQNDGVFILRIEDTDQVRYVEGAENYILEALEWLGLTPDEGVRTGGDFAPYRQSERKEIYSKYAQQLIENGNAYLAFDTPADLETARANNPTFKYNFAIRDTMKNALSMSEQEVEQRLAAGEPYVVRIKIPRGELISFEDKVRGTVTFQSDELDDKVILKADGMPTYHLANVIDDHLMEITHVIRGEEWLPSTPLHVVLYRAFGWEATMPSFAHLPLILKPAPESYIQKNNVADLTERLQSEFFKKFPELETVFAAEARSFIKAVLEDKKNIPSRLKEGKKDEPALQTLKEFLKGTLFGKLSKRDGDRLGFPVFPLSWEGNEAMERFKGFREFGFLPDALLNFLAFLGWNPGTEQEIFSLQELIATFDMERVSKSGARFNFDKARWFNQQYLMAMPNHAIVEQLKPLLIAKNYEATEAFLNGFVGLMKERVETLMEFCEAGSYFFEPVRVYDEKTISKKWTSQSRELFERLVALLLRSSDFEETNLEHIVKEFLEVENLKFGDVFPILRIALSGTTMGPSLFGMMELLGREEVESRFRTAFQVFDDLIKKE